MVRAQARSSIHPTLDGAFFRGFDFEKWEAWGSDADIGWGAWSVETGWTQSWITTVLGFRQLNTSLWQLGQEVEESITDDFEALVETMFEPVPPPPPQPCLKHPAGQSTVNYTLTTAITALCAPSPGSNVSHVVYTGAICGNKSIVWNSMRNPSPREGYSIAQCEWSRQANPNDIPEFFGDCGTSGTSVTLPTSVC